MLQVPKTLLPGSGTPKSISVSPVGGRLFRIPILGIENARSHPYELLVFILNIVGFPALAETVLGE